MFLNCGIGKDFWESLGLQGDPTINPEGNQSWILVGRTNADVPILWLPDAKNWLSRKDLDAGKDWRQEEKVTTEDEMVGWNNQLDGHEFEYAQGVGGGQGSLAAVHGVAKSHKRLSNWTELKGKKKKVLVQWVSFSKLTAWCRSSDAWARIWGPI